MRRLFPILAAFAAAAAAAPAASGGNPAVSTVDLAAKGKGSSTAAQRFTLAGIHWRGPGTVAFRTRSLDGRWSAWRPAAPEDEDGPDAGSRELRVRSGWRIGNPWWVGASDRVEVRTRGRVMRVRAHLVWSPETRIPYRTPAATTTPPIVPRLSWGADESIRRAPPAYADQIRFSVVHHTAGQNDYTRAQAPAIVKGIQLYHITSNGWNDIGYNFLVDRFGTIYEGRFGGAERNVIGAHAQGFNTGSVGVALLGSYASSASPQAAQDAIAQLLAWRLDLAHVDPTTALTFVSGGSNRFPTGVPVLLRGVSGHRDTGFTECPGNQLYGRLNTIAAAAAQIGGPKIYEPRVETGEGLVRFRARLSSSQPWVVTVTDAARLEVARGSGTGTKVDWTLDSTLVPAGRYTWRISSGTARAAKGPLRIGGAVAGLAIQEFTATPSAITPNGDGQGDAAVVGFRLTAAANVTVEVVDGSGLAVTTVLDRVWKRAGKHAVAVAGAMLPDGAYDVVVRARAPSGVEVEKVVPLLVSRTLGLVSVTPSLFSPNEDGRNDRLEIAFTLTAAADVSLRILREGRWVASPHTASYDAGAHVFPWDGIRAAGRLRDGAYSAEITVTDALVGEVSTTVPFVSDTVAPRIRLLPARGIRVAVDEPATLYLTIDGARRERVVRKPGVVRIRWEGAARRVRVAARDAAGNASTPLVRIREPAPGQ